MFDGPVLPLLVRLSVPIFLGMLIQLVYNVINVLWVSQIDPADPSYVGGTGIIFPLIFVAIALSNGLQVGVSALVAQAVGAGDRATLGRVAESGLAAGLLFGFAATAAGYAFEEPLLVALGARGDYLAHAREYLRWILPLGPVIMASAVFWGILQGEGKMKYVMRSMIVGTVANVVLDPIFIFTLGLKVEGAAMATVLAQVLSLVYLLGVFIGGKSQIEVEWKLANIHPAAVGSIFRVGFPQATGMIVMSLSFLAFNRLMVDIDPLAFTAFTLCGRMDQAVLLPSFAIAAAVLTMAGQNFGRGNMPRLALIWRTAWRAAALVVAAIAALEVLTAPLFYPFFSSNRSVIDFAVGQTRVVSISFVLAVFTIIARSFFQGLGKSMPALVLPVLRLVVFAIPAAYLSVLFFGLGPAGIWLGLAFGNAASALVSFVWVENKLKTLNYNFIRS